ncbi:MAG: phosphoenolpyruvate--protein phosphotransferase [Ferrimicrobium sp.]
MRLAPGEKCRDVIGIVVVSHSRRLAEAAVNLALEMVPLSFPLVEIAAGLDVDVLGTDAAQVKLAIDRVASPEGVLIFMDLGSAILSAELALELRGVDDHTPIILSEAPLVEGLVAAMALAGAGASLEEIAKEAVQSGQTKARLLGRNDPVLSDLESPHTGDASIELNINTAHGLHARPAARLVETVRNFDAMVRVRNLTLNGPAVNAGSFSAVSTLGALDGHRIEVSSSGPQAREVLTAVAALVHRGFDEPTTANATIRTAMATKSSPVVVATTVKSNGGPFAASPGIGIGPKVSLGVVDLSFEDSSETPRNVNVERQRLGDAIDEVRGEILSTRGVVAHSVGEGEAAIFDAHRLLLDDDDLVGAAQLIVEGGASAPSAWTRTVESLVVRFSELADPYLRARAADVRAVGNSVLARLLDAPMVSVDQLTGVVVAEDLTPSQVALLNLEKVVGIVTTKGTPVSHLAILARSLGIPAVVGADEALLQVPDGRTMIIDGTHATVIVDPEQSVQAGYRERSERERSRFVALRANANEPAFTTDGMKIEVLANIASVDDARQAIEYGGDGVGLLRTEFLFLDRTTPPSEEEQLEVYLAIGEVLGGRRLTARTLDAGGDKPMPFLMTSVEANPFLGIRGLRLSLQNPEFFKEQLRALLRAAQRFPMTVLFPMVTTIDELQRARTLLFEAAHEIGCGKGELPAGLEVGAMAEVPAFALRARAVSGLVDLISVGTNDLTQYTLAAERGNASVARLADSFDPAILTLIGEIARPSTAVAAVCGELAGDPLATAVLIGLGIRELSMNPRSIPEIKESIRAISISEAERIAEKALSLDTAADVRALLESRCG